RLNAGLQAFQNGSEKHAPRAAHDYGNGVCLPLFELTRVVVGRVTIFRDCGAYTLLRSLVYAGTAVEHAGNRADSNPSALCNIPNRYVFLHEILQGKSENGRAA